jgi:integrase
MKHGAFWYVKKGKWQRIGATLGEAMEEYAKLHEQPRGGMADLIDRAYAHHCKVSKLADSTKDQYRTAANVLKRKLALFAPGQVKAKHVAKVKADMAEHPNMANRAISFLRTVFHYAVEWGEVESNPCIGVKRHTEAKRKRYLTHEEFSAIYAKAGDRLQAIMDLQYLTGQRISDVLKLRRSQITEAGILLKPQKTKNSTGVEMLLKWTPELKAAVERAKALSGNVPALTLLRGRGGKPPDYRTVLAQFHKAAKEAGIEGALPNDQRAKSATDSKRQGKNPQTLLGHSSPAMTERYIRQHDTPEVEGPSFVEGLRGKTSEK